MISTKKFAVVAVLAIATLGAVAFIKPRPSNNIKADNKGFAVVELFTSEGCSSCPPADDLVAKIEKESKDKPVYILAYHVDYWNRLGWKDVFSSADYSKRQNNYANYLHLQSVYTPQIIVNGKTEFVGSDESALRNAIKNGLQKTPSASLSLSTSAIDQNQVTLKYSTEGTDGHTALLVAVLQKNAQTKVERGENGGHILSHVQIVRKLQQFSLNGNSGVAKVVLPQGYDARNYEIIGFLQNTANGSVVGASKAVLSADVNTSAAIVKGSK